MNNKESNQSHNQEECEEIELGSENLQNKQILASV